MSRKQFSSFIVEKRNDFLFQISEENFNSNFNVKQKKLSYHGGVEERRFQTLFQNPVN